jgi:hypothetical protein
MEQKYDYQVRWVGEDATKDSWEHQDVIPERFINDYNK